MPATRVTLNSRGVRELLGAPGVRAELAKVAQRVARRAGDGVKVEPATTGGFRGVVHVVDDAPGALAREAHTGRLARSLDGA